MNVTLDIIVPVHEISTRNTSLRKILSITCPSGVKFIIVSDSASEDDHKIVESTILNSENPNSQAVYGEFCGPGKARNAGLSVATGDWVAFLDSDDEVDLDLMISLLANASKDSAQLAIGGIGFHSEKTIISRKFFLDPRISIFRNISMTPAFTRMIFRRSLVSEIDFPEFKMAEDQCFVLNVLALSPILYTEEIYFYCYNVGSFTQSTKNLIALRDISCAVGYIDSHFISRNSKVLEMAIIMLLRLSGTYFKSVGLSPNFRSLKILFTLAKTFLLHPVLSLVALALILKFRPKDLMG